MTLTIDKWLKPHPHITNKVESHGNKKDIPNFSSNNGIAQIAEELKLAPEQIEKKLDLNDPEKNSKNFFKGFSKEEHRKREKKAAKKEARLLKKHTISLRLE